MRNFKRAYICVHKTVAYADIIAYNRQKRGNSNKSGKINEHTTPKLFPNPRSNHHSSFLIFISIFLLNRYIVFLVYLWVGLLTQAYSKLFSEGGGRGSIIIIRRMR